MVTCILLFVQPVATHLKRVTHTQEQAERRNRYRRDRGVIKEMAKELGEKATVLTMRWKTIRRVQIFRVELCIIVAIIIPSPPPTSLLTDSMTDSLLSLSLCLFVSSFPSSYSCFFSNWQTHNAHAF